jgi:uncharacterized protein (TIGR02147 family)
MDHTVTPFYREVLKRELGARLRRRGSYSLRAFARDLGVPAPKLSQILSGKCGLSPKRAMLVADQISLSEKERATFVTSVRACHGRSIEEREYAKSLLEADEQSYSEIDLLQFKAIANWYYFAILEMTEFNHPVYLETVQTRLGLSAIEAGCAIAELSALGLLKKEMDGRLVQITKDLATTTDIPSRDIREHHSQILRRAELSLESEGVATRDFSSMTLAIDSERVAEAKIWLKEFRRKFCKKLEQDPVRDRVYCLALQFFPLDKIGVESE